jgi:hypothetical protein
MASDFGKVLAKIESENKGLNLAQARLGRAFEKLDSRLTRLAAMVRIEPYEIDKKSGLQIGYRRFEDRWSISTIVHGVAGLEAEVPVAETSPDRQAALIPHVAGLLEKVADALVEEHKTAQKAADEADRLLAALP